MAYNTAYLSSPDTQSIVYPDRLIRPLPKRSLKSRLSQEAAESITYPPTLPSTSLPTYSQYGENGEYTNDGKVLVQQNGDLYDDHDHDHHHNHDHIHDHDNDHDHDHDHDHYHDHSHDHDDHDHCHHYHHCHHEDEDELDSADEISPVALRHSSSYRSSPRSPHSARQTRYGHANTGSTSGLDGYEAFENTNNKKKRKIPTSGNVNLHQSSLTNDLSRMGVNADQDGLADEAYYAQGGGGSAGMGIQGAGRGRNGRKTSGRHPLGVSVNGSNTRNGPAKYDQSLTISAKGDETKDQGIISAAIANATALLRKPPGKGQENLGVLDQQAKSPPTNSQFTFTCETDAKGVTFPEQSLYSPGYAQRNHNYAPVSALDQRAPNHQGTQTSANMPLHGSQHMQASQPPNTAGAQGKKPRRRRGDVYALAARQRKLQQEYTNLQHPPAPEDIWICEFCEYESIFGQPPHALIRQYEIKDRRERRRLAEKRRLLEKAKLKGRKGKKQTKNAAKAANSVAQLPNNQQAYDQESLDQLGDNDLDYGYDDDPIAMPAPPQGPAKQSMPGSYHATMGKGAGPPAEVGVQ